MALGYRFNRYLAAELAYTDYGEVDIREHYVVGPIDSPFFPFFPAFEIDVDLASRVAGPSLSVLGILPVADGFDLFARAGILFADQNVSRVPFGGATNAEELLTWGAGMDVEITGRWSVRFAYENVEDLRRTQYTGPSGSNASWSERATISNPKSVRIIESERVDDATCRWSIMMRIGAGSPSRKFLGLEIGRRFSLDLDRRSEVTPVRRLLLGMSAGA